MPPLKKFQTSFVGTGILPACGGSGGRGQGLEGKAHSCFVLPRQLLYVVPGQHLSTGLWCFLNLALRWIYCTALGKPLPLPTKQRECPYLSKLGASMKTHGNG